MAKNNTKLGFLRQGKPTGEGCFVEIDQGYFEKTTEREKEKNLSFKKKRKNIKTFSDEIDFADGIA